MPNPQNSEVLLIIYYKSCINNKYLRNANVETENTLRNSMMASYKKIEGRVEGGARWIFLVRLARENSAPGKLEPGNFLALIIILLRLVAVLAALAS